MGVTEGEKLTPARNGAAQVGGFRRGQRRDLVRLGGEELAPWAQSTALVQAGWSSRFFTRLCCHSDTSIFTMPSEGDCPRSPPTLPAGAAGLKSGGGFSFTRLVADQGRSEAEGAAPVARPPAAMKGAGVILPLTTATRMITSPGTNASTNWPTHRPAAASIPEVMKDAAEPKVTGRTMISSDVAPASVADRHRPGNRPLVRYRERPFPCGVGRDLLPVPPDTHHTAPDTSQDTETSCPTSGLAGSTSRAITAGASGGPWARTGAASQGQTRARARSAAAAMVARRRRFIH